MMDRRVTAIVLRGTVGAGNWLEWLTFATSLGDHLRRPATHVGVLGGPLGSSKLRTLARMRSRLEETLDEEESISGVSLYSLPKGFSSAFDCAFFAQKVVSLRYVAVGVRGTLDSDPWEYILGRLGSHIEAASGELVTADAADLLGKYMGGTWPNSEISSLRVVRKLSIKKGKVPAFS